jgi:nucleoside-diphosphate-sugar epimerase
MKYFLTGATGFVGGRVARQLRSSGHDVTALVRDPAKATELWSLGVRLAKGDVTDPVSLRTMDGADGVFHIAGWYKIGVKDTSPGVAVNIEGTRNVLTAMREHQIPKGVYTSTLAVNSDTQGQLVDETYRFAGTHLSEYDRTKAAAHAVAEEFIAGGLPLVIVQPGLIYGPGDAGPSHDFLVSYLRRALPMLPQQTAYSWAHVDDVARAHILAMERGGVGEHYFVCGPTHTAIEALRLAQELCGVPAPALTAPPWMLKGLAAVMGLVEHVVSVPDTYSREYLRVSAGATYIGNNAKARRELGWEPRPLREGLDETLRHTRRTLNMD